MNKKPVQTIADIARLANVSKSTVSRVLSDSPLIGEATKERVRAIAEQNHFLVNVQARQLSLKQSRTIAFVVHPFNNDFSIADLFVLEVMGGISNGLSAEGYDMLVVQVDPQETGWVHQYLDSGRVDGFILLTSSYRQRHIQALQEMEAPFIVWVYRSPDRPSPPFRGTTFREGNWPRNTCSSPAGNGSPSWAARRTSRKSSCASTALQGPCRKPVRSWIRTG